MRFFSTIYTEEDRKELITKAIRGFLEKAIIDYKEENFWVDGQLVYFPVNMGKTNIPTNHPELFQIRRGYKKYFSKDLPIRMMTFYGKTPEDIPQFKFKEGFKVFSRICQQCVVKDIFVKELNL